MRRLRGDLSKLAEGKTVSKKAIILDVLQILSLAAAAMSGQAQSWAAAHGTVTVVAVGVLAALNRLLPSWFQQAQR